MNLSSATETPKNTEGIVTEVNYALLYFEVDDDKRIYINIKNDLPIFPTMGDMVKIIGLNLWSYSDTWTGVMGPQTVYNFPTTNIEATQLFWRIKSNNIYDPEEFLAMDQIIKKLEKKIPRDVVAKSIILMILELPKDKRSFKKINVMFPHNLGCTQNIDTPMMSEGTCNFSVNPNQGSEIPYLNAEFLFGNLDVDISYGCFSLNSRLLVKFKPYNGDLYNFKNTLVMVKKWTLFTETCQVANTFTLEYILIDFKDVVILKPRKESNEKRTFYGKDEHYRTEAIYNTMFFQTIRISDVLVGHYEQPECWIEGFMSERGPTCSKRNGVHLCCTNLSIVPFLKEGTVYKLFYRTPPSRDYACPELFALKDGNQTYRMSDKDTIFQETNERPYLKMDKVLNTVQEVKNFIVNTPPNQLFSVRLKIYQKVLQDISQFKSYNKRRFFNNVPYYGNPGENRQMQITFYDSETDQYLDLYLTNRDNHITPLGLVEDMIVKIKHVQHCKKKYLKTSVFTSFEIVEYSPKIIFSSVDLRYLALGRWWTTRMTPLGLFYSLPLNCIVRGSFMLKAIYDLVITPICLSCRRCVLAGRPCSDCKITKRDLSVQMTILVQDARNPNFKVNAGRDYFFKTLGLEDHKQCEMFSNAFYKCDPVSINFCKMEEFDAELFTQDPKSREILTDLVDTIYSFINFNLYSWTDAVCERKPGPVSWDLIDFKMVFNADINEINF